MGDSHVCWKSLISVTWGLPFTPGPVPKGENWNLLLKFSGPLQVSDLFLISLGREVGREAKIFLDVNSAQLLQEEDLAVSPAG